jgi:hypothetical protein
MSWMAVVTAMTIGIAEPCDAAIVTTETTRMAPRRELGRAPSSSNLNRSAGTPRKMGGSQNFTLSGVVGGPGARGILRP